MLREPHNGVYMVTGYDEAVAVYSDHTTFSSCNTVSGPFVKFSVPVEGDDISDVIDAHRDELPFSDQLPSFDPPKHTAHRGLLMRLITPKRLKENEEFMWRLADRQIDEILAHGNVRVHRRVRPAVHAARHRRPARRAGVRPRRCCENSWPRTRWASAAVEPMAHKPLEFLYEQFTAVHRGTPPRARAPT